MSESYLYKRKSERGNYIRDGVNSGYTHVCVYWYCTQYNLCFVATEVYNIHHAASQYLK